MTFSCSAGDAVGKMGDLWARRNRWAVLGKMDADGRRLGICRPAHYRVSHADLDCVYVSTFRFAPCVAKDIRCAPHIGWQTPHIVRCASITAFGQRHSVCLWRSKRIISTFFSLASVKSVWIRMRPSKETLSTGFGAKPKLSLRGGPFRVGAGAL